MEKTALTCSSCDDLIRFAKKLDALGQAISALAFHGSEHLRWSGEQLGGIVSDYADAIKNVLNDFYWPIENIFTNGDTSFLSELKYDQKTIQAGHMGLHGNLRIAEDAVKKIDDFLNDNLKQITDMSVYFGETGREIARQLREGSEQKEALATAHDQAGAQGVDQS